MLIPGAVIVPHPPLIIPAVGRGRLSGAPANLSVRVAQAQTSAGLTLNSHLHLVVLPFSDDSPLQQYRVKRGGDSAQSDGNTIRIGAILDYLMFGLYEDKPFLYEEQQQKIEACLTEQFKAARYVEAAGQKEECERLRTAITSDYTAYQSESLFAGVVLREYIGPISGQIRLLFEQEDIRRRLKTGSTLSGSGFSGISSAEGGGNANKSEVL